MCTASTEINKARVESLIRENGRVAIGAMLENGLPAFRMGTKKVSE